MAKPLFSLSYSIDQNAQNIFDSWLKSWFWQKSWCSKSQNFQLPAVSTKVQGVIKLQPLLPQYSVSVANLQPGKSLEFLLNSSYHSLNLAYSLTGDEPTILNITVTRSEQLGMLNNFFDWLAKPYLLQHSERVATLCREITPTIDTTETVIKSSEDTTKVEPIFPTIGFFLWHLVNTWQHQIDRVLKQFNLTSTQWLLLFNLLKSSEAKQTITISHLSVQLGLNEVHVSDVITSLVRKHYVHKVKFTSDRRKFQLTATPDGKIAATQANLALIQTEKKFFHSLESGQRQQLASLITQLATPIN